MRSMSAAREVDLPEPVPPVTRIIPNFSLAISSNNGRQVQPLHGGNLRGKLAHDYGKRSPLTENVHPEPGPARQGVGQIARAVGRQVLKQPGVLPHHAKGHGFGLEGEQRTQLRVRGKVRQLAVHLALQRLARHHEHVRHPRREVQYPAHYVVKLAAEHG